jgi:hypothetical protein
MGATFGSKIMLEVLNHPTVEDTEGLARSAWGPQKIKRVDCGFKFPRKPLISMVGAQGLEPWTR